MVEPEMAFYELTDNMDLAERFLKRIFKDALEQCPEDMAFFNEHYDKTTLETLAEDRRQRLPPAALHRSRREFSKAAARSSSFP